MTNARLSPFCPLFAPPFRLIRVHGLALKTKPSPCLMCFSPNQHRRSAVAAQSFMARQPTACGPFSVDGTSTMPIEYEMREGALGWIKNPISGVISYVVDVRGTRFAFTLGGRQELDPEMPAPDLKA